MSVFHNIKEFLTKTHHLSIQKTNSPNIYCTRLENHWRSNKSLPTPFVVLIMTPVTDGTLVTVSAGNEECYCGEVRNESAKVSRQIARFQDLRFVGKSGRGKSFNLTITVHSEPMMVAMVPKAIKVTVDGPRDARTPKPIHTEILGKRKHCAPPMSVFPFPGQITSFEGMMPLNLQLGMPLLPPQIMFRPQISNTITPQRVPIRTIDRLAPPSVDSSPETSTASLKLTTPTSEAKRKRDGGSDSSAGSSPTIWRPYVT